MGRSKQPQSVNRRSDDVHTRPEVGRRPVGLEPLEGRQLYSVALNAAGWTVVTPSSSARVVYVSAAHGNDANTGLSTAAPVKTLAAATALVRSGHDDQLLLERGDTWTTSFPQWTKSGISGQQPMVIGTYGSGARPVIDTGTANGLVANTKNPTNYLLIDGIDFVANARDPALGPVTAAAAASLPIGLQILGPSTGLTVEDCSFTYFANNVDLETATGPVSNVTIRRSTIADAYALTGHSQGLYAGTLNGLTLDQDVFDHNGWNASVAGAVATGYNHDVYYYSTAQNVTITNSVIAEAAYAGIMARSGGVIDNNLILDNAVGIDYGTAYGSLSVPGGVRGEVKGNVILGDHGLPTGAFGEGIEVGNTAKGANVTVSGNVFAGDTEHAQAAISLTAAGSTSNPGAAVGLNDLTVADNVVYGWRNALSVDGLTAGGTGIQSLSNLTVTGNQFQATPNLVVLHSKGYSPSQEHWSANAYADVPTATFQPFDLDAANVSAATWRSTVDPTGTYAALSYVDPTRSAASYSSSLGGASSLAAFLAKVDAQSQANWDGRYTASAALAYLKGGFVLTAAPASTVATTTNLTGAVTGTGGSFNNWGNTAGRAEDGNLSTFFDGATADGNVVGLDLGSAKAVGQVSFAPRPGWAGRMVGGVFQASNSPTFSAGVTTLYTITATPATGVLTTVTVPTTNARYVRYVSPAGSYGNAAEVQFLAPATKLAGTTISTAGSYQGGGNTAARATDGNPATFFDGPTADGDWVGLDLGSATAVKQVAFAPRSGFAARMVGGVFQASNSATFSTGVTTLHTITATPAEGTLTTVTLSSPVTAQYLRYLAPNGSYGDVAEVQFLG